MAKRLVWLPAAAVLAIAGVLTAVALASTGTVSVCATSPVQTIDANGVKVGTISPKVACVTTMYTVPTVTNTVTTTQTVTTTVTAPTTTTTPPPPSGIKGYYDQGSQASDWPDYKQYGFNTVVATNPTDSTLYNELKADGAKEWVQANFWQNGSCSYQYSASTVLPWLQGAVAAGVVSGFYIADEPSASCSNGPADTAAWTATLHQNFPGIPTVISEYNSSDLTAYANSADEFALDTYPCQYGNGCNYSWITQLAASADSLGLKYVGVVQAFGGDSAGHYDLPTQAQEQQILNTWKATNEIGWVAYAFSASGTPSSDWLQNHPELLSVIEAG
jgi:hypothetical protein